MTDTANSTISRPLEERVESLETRVAFQEKTIDELNEAITAQWDEMEKLRIAIARLSQQVRDVENAMDGPGGSEPPPPHY